MNLAPDIRQQDRPVLTVDFTDHIQRYGASDATVSSCTVTCFLATASAPHGGASDPDYPDAAASTRATGSATVSSPYASITFGGGDGAGAVEGADYIVQFFATASDGAKYTAQFRVPVRTYV